MKNKIIIFLFCLSFLNHSNAENLNIEASSITLDKKTKSTIFKGEVIASDSKNNVFKTNFAEYDNEQKLLISKGETTILTSEGISLTGKDIIFDNNNFFIKSDKPALIQDLDKNEIFLENFEYSTKNNFFKSVGNIKLLDTKNNSYNFSQIYIDEKKREIIGTDIKAFLNQDSFKINKKNKPRVFANTMNFKEDQSKFSKSVFTICDYRKNDKCPPWLLQANNMTHDKKKKTIYYDNAVLKIYDLPIFYFPKLSHPDPTVERRSGFLPPSFSDSKNLGAGFGIPYYWDLGKNKDFTLTSKLFTSEHPLFLSEYRHAFEKSYLISDFGYTEGYKKTTSTKTSGSKSHFFTKFIKSFRGKNNSENNFELTFQNVSNNKYLRLYKIKTDLVEYETDSLENSLNFSHEDEDLFFGFKASAYETLKDNYNDKYEYILPEIIIDKNLFTNNKFGNADFQSNLKVHNYDTNKFTKFFVNNIDWKFRNLNYDSGFAGSFLGKIKNVNYEAKNTDEYKDDTTSELFGVLGFLTKIDLFKKTVNNGTHFLTPKALFRYSPDHMRKEAAKIRLSNLNIFTLDRLDSVNNFESGSSATLGFDYKFERDNLNKINFSLGQILNVKENSNMPSSSGLNQRFSDVVGSSNFRLNDNINFSYNFSLDQNYKDLNYNELETKFDFNPIKFNLNYLEEKEHIGNQEYLKAGLKISKGETGLFEASTKRNLITNSAEYYDLSYEYINDCLRAGLVYRREFYNDSELEPENSLMFKVTIVPFGNINSPSFSQ